MLEGKSVQPSQTSVELDFDLEEEREKIRAELRKEFEEQIKSKLGQKQLIPSEQIVPPRKDGQYDHAVMSQEVIQGQHIDTTEPNVISETQTSPAIVNEIDTANAIQKLQVNFNCNKNSFQSMISLFPYNVRCI